MKQAEVVVGGSYITSISGQRVPVTVLERTQDYWSGRTAFRVQRKDNGKVLPKVRTAAALSHTRLSGFLQRLGPALAALG